MTGRIVQCLEPTMIEPLLEGNVLAGTGMAWNCKGVLVIEVGVDMVLTG